MFIGSFDIFVGMLVKEEKWTQRGYERLCIIAKKSLVPFANARGYKGLDWHGKFSNRYIFGMAIQP